MRSKPPQGVDDNARAWALDDLLINQGAVNHWYTIEAFLDDARYREEIFRLMGI